MVFYRSISALSLFLVIPVGLARRGPLLPPVLQFLVFFKPLYDALYWMTSELQHSAKNNEGEQRPRRRYENERLSVCGSSFVGQCLSLEIRAAKTIHMH